MGGISLSALFACNKLTYPNSRGLKLAGLLFTGPDLGTVIIVCHGFTGSKEGGGKALSMSEELGRRGYAAMLFDFCGCGESEGDFSDISLTSHISDIKSTVDFCLQAGFNRVITTGRSFGGTAALCQGAIDNRVAGVSAWAALAKPTRLFAGFLEKAGEDKHDLVPLSGQDGTVYVKRSFFHDLYRHDVTGKAALIAPRPLQVVHGSDDNVVPVRNADIIFNAAREPKAMKIISGADHQFTGHYRQAWEAFFKWLEEYFPV
ncbi:MAG: alpha/beta hydrolase [Desulfotomaculaceae bacterium]